LRRWAGPNGNFLYQPHFFTLAFSFPFFRYSWLLVLLLAGCQSSPAPLRVTFVGDVLLARAVPAALAHDSAALLRHTQTAWAGSRYIIGNLECPLADTARPVAKRFVFRADPRYAPWLRRLGLTHVSLANNHTLDQQLPGLCATARHLRAAGVGALGYRPDPATGCRPTLLGANSSVAVFAYSALTQKLPGEGCLCGRDFEALCERLATYKTLFPQRAVLVYLHWGTEYAGQPSTEQRRQARTLIDCGAAAVVGAHPHVVQRMEFYHGRPIIYSLGNFIFDQSGHATDLTVQADFDIKDGEVRATHLRPWQLVRAVPQPATEVARAALAARIRQLSPTVQLLEDEPTDGWQLLPAATKPAPAAGPGYFARHLQLTDSAGPTATVQVRYLPLARQYEVRVQTPDGAEARLPVGSPLYRLTQGDVDNDGHPDLLLGPVKAARFDSTVQRRLFVYRLTAGRLVPRWLGTRLMYRLVYFKAIKVARRTFVLTIEQQPDGRYCLGRYYWQGFGLVLDHFPARNLSREAAYLAFITTGL
jgi:poly-gamma-glutamate synthesis protein (capsule biosynthesis protein)